MCLVHAASRRDGVRVYGICREELGKAWKTERVLMEVTEGLAQTVTGSERKQVQQEIREDKMAAAAKTQVFTRQNFNMIDLDAPIPTDAPLWKRRVGGAIALLHDLRGVPNRGRFKDMLHYLQFVFGFQEDNVRNQREHLVLLLANSRTYDEKGTPIAASMSDDAAAMNLAVDSVSSKVLGNFLRWAQYLHVDIPYFTAEHRMLHTCLFLLIWGEAANVRFLPECLCYLFHQMASELAGMMQKTAAEHSHMMGTGGEYAFLNNVIMPFYRILKLESDYAGAGSDAKGHPAWRNYDDFNEFFWSKRCFELGWPIHTSHVFFKPPPVKSKEPGKKMETPKTATGEDFSGKSRLSKTLFVEWRSFLHLYRSFDRMWAFLLLMFQGMAIVAFSGQDGSTTLMKVLSVVPMAAILRFFQVLFDILLSFGAYRSMSVQTISRKFLRLAVLGVWGGFLSFFLIQGFYPTSPYLSLFLMLASISVNPVPHPYHPLFLILAAIYAILAVVLSLLDGFDFSSPYRPLFLMLAAIYVIPAVVLSVLMRFVTPLRSQLDRVSHHRFFQFVKCHHRFFQFIKWFYQVGGGSVRRVVVLPGGWWFYQVGGGSTRYSLFWVVLLLCKCLFSYYFQILPLVGPTRYIIGFKHLKYRWKDLVSASNYNALTLLSIWAPVFVIYLIDAQIWYTVLSAILSTLIGAWWHLGEIRTLSMLRARFRSFPAAFMNTVHHQNKFNRTRSTSLRSSARFQPLGSQQPASRHTHTHAHAHISIQPLPHPLPLLSSTSLRSSARFQPLGSQQPASGSELLLSSRREACKFAIAWNEIIRLLREEDYLSDREYDLLIMPALPSNVTVVQWPLFLLANQILLAVGEASGRKESQSSVWRKVTADEYMRCAVLEAYQSLRPFLLSVVEPTRTAPTAGTAAAATQEAGSGVYEARIINRLFDDLEVEGNNGSLLTTFRFSALPVILDRLSKLTAVLIQDQNEMTQRAAVQALQALYDTVKFDFLSPDHRASLEEVSGKPQSYCLFAAVAWPANRAAVKRLHLLLTIKESAMDVPHNLEARRRLQFFTNSLHMRMPDAPKVADTLPFCVMTPYYSEIVTYSMAELVKPNEDGISTLFYLQKIFPAFLLVQAQGTCHTATAHSPLHTATAAHSLPAAHCPLQHILLHVAASVALIPDASQPPLTLITTPHCRRVAQLPAARGNGREGGGDEWANFLQRVGMGEKELEVRLRARDDIKELRMWASYRGCWWPLLRRLKCRVFSPPPLTLIIIAPSPPSPHSADEWANFLQRVGMGEKELEVRLRAKDDIKELRMWASYRGQTLARTVRGMMYYHRALRLLAYMETPNSTDLELGADGLPLDPADRLSTAAAPFFTPDPSLRYPSSPCPFPPPPVSLPPFFSPPPPAPPFRPSDLELGADGLPLDPADRLYLAKVEPKELADVKFTYVVTCQIYGKQKADKDQRAADIFNLMKEHEALRVAYIDEVVTLPADPSRPDARPKTEHFSRLVKVDTFGSEQDIYKVKLPGPAKLGEGKPENQNHAIIFTRGEALQTIDMNQDNYFEETLKMRNLLQEFAKKHGLRKPSILGVREHIFTGSVSSLAWFMSNQETSFVTLGQRFLAIPLKVRMHYGHPDVFDRLFHITRGGMSKASKTINISEDIFAGFNTTLRQGNVTHHEYIQVGKGRDVGLNQIALFEAKVASGNGEQVLSRDICRLGQLFDFYRLLSFYFTSVGFFLCTTLTSFCAFLFLYGRVYLSLSGVGATLSSQSESVANLALESAINTQFLIQAGFFTAVPMIMGFILEQGFLRAVVSFITMQLQLASVFFTFSLGTRAHYFLRTLLHGGAKYRATGRGFVVRHIKFADNYRLYSRSHFTYGTVADFEDWVEWLWYKGGVGVKGEQSWESWWEEETEHVRSIRSRIIQVVLNLRFFFVPYGIVYQLNVAQGNTSIL
ncbi:unnamed protein product, partial [Closterium sp. Naga37s-1]